MSASLTDNQLYVLRPVSAPDMQMAIGGGSTVNGAKAIIYPILEYDNDQKWVAVDDGSDGWTLQNMETLKYSVVSWPTSASPWHAGSEIVQWAGGTENRYLTPVQVDTATIDGVECPVVAFRVKAHDGLAYSVSDALYYGSLKVVLADYDAADETQQWVCIPTVARSYDIPAPYNLGVSGDTEKDASSSVSFSVYPTWTAAASQAAQSGLTYLVRSRSRVMDLSGQWGEWTAWGLFKTASVSQDGQDVAGTAALTATVSSTEKTAEVEYEVRCCTPASGSGNVYDRPWAGPAAAYIADLCLKPVVTLSDASWSPDGISIAATSTYGSRGATGVLVTSVVLAGKELLTEPCESTIIGASGTVDIPQALLRGIPGNGDEVAVSYTVSSDLKAFGDALSDELEVGYTVGSFTPTITENTSDMTLSVDAGDDARVWVLLDGQVVECPKNADGTFMVLYPFGRGYELFAAGMHNSAKFAYYAERTESTRPCHAWNWDGGSARLELREGEPLTVPDTIDASSQSYELNGREYQTVSFTGSKSHRLTASGALVDGVTGSARADFLALAGVHCTYRSPAGDILPVAVAGISREARDGWTQVDVTMFRESE